MAQAVERAATGALGTAHSSSSSEAELYLSACSDAPVELVGIEPALVEDGGLEAAEDAFGVHDVLADADMPEPAPAPFYTLDSTPDGQLQSSIFFHQVEDAIEAAQAAAEPSLAALPPRESRPGTSDESTSRPAASESDSSTESSLLSACSQSEGHSSTLLRNSTGQMSVQSAEDSGVVSDGDGEAYKSGDDSPWTRRYANDEEDGFQEQGSDVDGSGSETDSEGMSTPPQESHPRHRIVIRAATPWRKLDKTPSPDDEVHTAPSGKTRGLSPGHESWSINYMSPELLQLIVDHLGPEAMYPTTDNPLLPYGPYPGHPAPKEAYQHRRVLDIFRWRAWFLSLRRLSRRFASAVFNSRSSWMAFAQMMPSTYLNKQPGSPFQLARSALRYNCCVVCMVPGQYLQFNQFKGFASMPVHAFALGKVPMCPVHARCIGTNPDRYHLACFNCLFIETDERSISVSWEHVAGPSSKKVASNLCSDCRQDLMEVQLMARFGRQPLPEGVYDECLEVHEYLYEGMRNAAYAARKAVEFAWLVNLPYFHHFRDLAVEREFKRRAQKRAKQAQLRSVLMPSAIGYAEEESDEDETAEGVWNDGTVRDRVRRDCLFWYSREKLLQALWLSDTELSELPAPLLRVSGPPLVPSLPIEKDNYGPGIPSGLVESDAHGRYIRQLPIPSPTRELRAESDTVWFDEVLPAQLGLPLHNIARHLQQEHGQNASDVAARTTVKDLLCLLLHEPFWHREKKAKKGFAQAKQDEKPLLPALPYSYTDIGLETCAAIETIWTEQSAFLSECACGICLRQKRKREAGDDGKADRSGMAPAAAEQATNEGVDERAPESREMTEWEEGMGGTTPGSWSNLTDAEEEPAREGFTKEQVKTLQRLINNCDAYGEERECDYYEEGAGSEEEEEEDDDDMSDTSREAQEARARSCAEALSADYLRD